VCPTGAVPIRQCPRLVAPVHETLGDLGSGWRQCPGRAGIGALGQRGDVGSALQAVAGLTSDNLGRYAVVNRAEQIDVSQVIYW